MNINSRKQSHLVMLPNLKNQVDSPNTLIIGYLHDLQLSYNIVL